MNESFVFYRSFAEALEELPPEQYKEVMTALTRYALDGTLPENMDPVLKGYFVLMKPQVDANNSKRENGRKGGNTSKQTEANASKAEAKASKPKQTEAKAKQTEANVNANANANVNANANAKESKRFAPPTVEEIAAYCRERGNHVDPQKFRDFYASKGWKVGNQPMKDWKAAVRTWEQRDDRFAHSMNPPDSPKHGIQRDEDLDAMLINQIVGRGNESGQMLQGLQGSSGGMPFDL